MNSKISFRLENDILMCFVTGERSNQGVSGYWKELINECHKKSVKYVQLTLAMRGKFDPFDAISHYQLIIGMLAPLKLKLAVRDLNHLSAPDTLVACNMGVSRGIDVAYFKSESEAINWLNQPKKPTNIDSSELNKTA